MKRTWMLILLLAAALSLGVTTPQASSNKEASANAPAYTADGNLKFPTNYREWVYLSSGFDMSYKPAMQMDHHMFDNVFVNPEAWRAFVKSGTWPDKTVLVLEARGAESRARLTRRGIFRALP